MALLINTNDAAIISLGANASGFLAFTLFWKLTGLQATHEIIQSFLKHKKMELLQHFAADLAALSLL